MNRFCCVPLILAGALGAQVVPEIEPNDTPGTAVVVTCGAHVEGAIDFAGDQDWFTITLASPSRLHLVTGTDENGVVLDAVMELRAATPPYDLVFRNDDEDRSWMPAISEFVPAGTWLVMVRGFGAGDVGGYSIDVQCDAGGAASPRVAEAAEPNGPFGVGAPTTIAVGELGLGDLTAGDSDLWQFTLTTPTTLRIETGYGLTGTSTNDTILFLLDQNGAQLDDDDDDAPGNWSLIMATLQPGTYFVDVQGYGGGNAGTYTLLLQGFDASATLPENPEPNGDPTLGGAPSVLACGVLGGGEITAGDSDWWEFSLGSDAFVDLTVWGGAADGVVRALDDSYLRIFDASSNELAADDDDFFDQDARLSARLPAGQYYAEVSGFGASAGTYTLRLTCDTQAQYHTFDGGCPGSNALNPRWNVREWELPQLGTTLLGEFSNFVPNGAIFPFAGFSRSLSTSGVPLPFDLGVLGAPGCDVEVDPAFVTVVLADAQGRASWHLALPLVPALAGVELAQQAFGLDLAANGLGLTTSNAGYGVLSTIR